MTEVASMQVDARALVAAFDRLSRADFSRALMEGAKVVEAAGKENIDRYDFIDTGATWGSVAPDAVSDYEVHIGPATDYAIYGELGTRYTQPKPFMREAIEENKAAINGVVADALRDAIRRAL